MKPPDPPADALRKRLQHVRWIGGGSGSGKSTIAVHLAAEHGLRVYHCDPHGSEHAARSSAEEAPLLHAFMAMDMDERWVTRSPVEMLQTFHGFRGEGFDLIVEDLVSLPSDRQVVAEGFRLLPRLVAPLLSRPDQAVWLIPTHEFRVAAFESRGSTWSIAGRTSAPERALANLLARDALFSEQIAGEVRALGLRAIDVDIGMTEDNLLALVAKSLGLSPVVRRRRSGGVTSRP